MPKLAKIPLGDDLGRTLNIHAFRTTFGTLLSKGRKLGRGRKQGGNPSPLLIRELVATRGWPPFGNRSPLMMDQPVFYPVDPLCNQFSDRP